MEKKRTEKGERYWYISYFLDVCYGYENSSMFDLLRFEANNYFVDREEAEATARKLRAVLNGADVIEMPSEEELRKNLPYQQFTRWSDGELGERNGWRDCYRWLKSKIIK